MVTLQDVQADLTRVKVNIGMKDLCHEADLRRRDRIVLLNLEVQLEPPPCVGGVWGPLDVASPVKEVVLDRVQEDV